MKEKVIKRRTRAVNCSSCRKLKIACDLGAPCTPCLNKNRNCSLLELLERGSGGESERLGNLFQSIRRSSGSDVTLDSKPAVVVDERKRDIEIKYYSRLLLSSDFYNFPPHLGGVIQAIQEAELNLGFSIPLPKLGEPPNQQTNSIPLAQIFSILPSVSAARQYIDEFFSSHNKCSSILYQPLLYRPSFESHCQSLWSGGAVDLHFLASYLVVCGVGSNGDILKRSLLDAAIRLLISTDYLRSPSIESLQTCVLLMEFWSEFSSGVHIASSIMFSTSVIESAFDLSLNVDAGAQTSPLAAELRRRVFYGLFHVDVLARCAIDAPLRIFSMDQISTLPPRFEDCAFEPSSGQFSTSTYSNSESSPSKLNKLTVILCEVSRLEKSRMISIAQIDKLTEELNRIEEGGDELRREGGDNYILNKYTEIRIGMLRGSIDREKASSLLGLVQNEDCTRSSIEKIFLINVAIDLALDSKKRNLAWSFELDSAFTTMKSLQHTSRIYLRAFIILSSLSPSQERNFNTSATEISGLAENYYYEMGNHYPPNLIAPHPQPARSLMENWIASTGNNFDYPAVC